MSLEAEELERRRPVWSALSELFLDTTLDAGDLRRIALVLHASRYSEQELDAIYADEVAPVCGPNLMVVAGEWALFDPEWLERRILARRRSALARLTGWIGRTFALPAIGHVFRKDYTEVKKLLARLRIDRAGLLKALGGSESEAVEAAATLAFQKALARAPDTFEALDAARRRPELPVRTAALQALAAVDPPRSVPILQEHLQAEQPEERRAALEALVEAARGLADAASQQGALAAALEPWLRAPEPRDRKRALMVIEEIAASPGVIPLLLGALDQPVEDNRLALAGALRAARPDIGELEPALLDALRPSQPTSIRQTAAQALVFLAADHRGRWPGDATRLLPALDDRDPLVRARMATALGWTGEPRALEPVIALAASPEVEIRASALYALGRLGHRAPERVIPVLREALASGDGAILSAAVQSAEDLGPSAAPLEADLRRALKHDNFFVRHAAKRALEAIEGRRGKAESA